MRPAGDQKRKDAGITLVEVMISLLILSIMAAGGAYVLRAAAVSQGTVTASGERLEALQLAHATLRDDLAHIVQRAPGSHLSRNPTVVFRGEQPGLNRPFLLFVRHGWVNPELAEARSDLVTVAYWLEKGVLRREVWLRPDPARGTPSQSLTLMEGIDMLELGYGSPTLRTDAFTGVMAGAGIAAPETILFDVRFVDGEALEWVFATSALGL